MNEYHRILLDVLHKTNAACHDVIFSDALPMKHHYYLNPIKLQYLRKEVKYMLDNDMPS